MIALWTWRSRGTCCVISSVSLVSPPDLARLQLLIKNCLQYLLLFIVMGGTCVSLTAVFSLCTNLICCYTAANNVCLGAVRRPLVCPHIMLCGSNYFTFRARLEWKFTFIIYIKWLPARHHYKPCGEHMLELYALEFWVELAIIIKSHSVIKLLFVLLISVPLFVHWILCFRLNVKCTFFIL